MAQNHFHGYFWLSTNALGYEAMIDYNLQTVDMIRQSSLHEL